MLRYLLALSISGILAAAPCPAQRIDNTLPPSQTANPPQAPLPGDAQVPAGPPQVPTSPDATKEDAPKKKSSKAKRTLQKALPDCINIIFSTCPGNSARQQEAEEQLKARRARAAERCRQLDAARPATAQPRKTELPLGESSSKSSIPDLQPHGCTPEDMLAAEHDVEVGDFNLGDKNYRGAEMRYRSALERVPGDPIATLRLARLLDKQGRNAEAYEQYKAYMAWSPTGADADEARAAMERIQKSWTK